MYKLVTTGLVVILLVNIFFLFFFKPKSVPQNELKTFTVNELIKYDGTNDNMPIYMVYNGDVYDVTAGREFYKIGGPYHDLAGKDSTTELNIAGGGIIKVKYTVVGHLIK
ncbi:MAG: cytochrome b5 domain-containing protein [Candidatus Shapirobacteria bacterium]